MKQQRRNNFSRRKQTSLLIEMVRTDFKLRYQNSFLGYIWSLLKPLFLFAILYTVFAKFLMFGAGVPNYALSLLLGIVLWSFFADATSGSLKSIVGKGSLLRKVYMPQYLIPLASVASAFINMLLSMTIVFIFLAFSSINALSWETVVFFPLLLLQLAVFSTGVGIFLAALYVKFRDLEYIWDVVRQALFYAIPIIYPLSRITFEWAQQLLMLNPLAQIIQSSRSIITYDGTTNISDVFSSAFVILIPISISFGVFVVGFHYFMNKSHTFAENV